MRNSLLAHRYAKALYNLAKEAGEQDSIFTNLRSVSEGFKADSEVAEYFASPLVRPSEKVKVIEKLLEQASTTPTLKNFLLLLAKKNRLGVLEEIGHALQTISDEGHGVTRGTVRSAAVLSADERKKIEEKVSRATQKQVILNYTEDPSLLGGLVAEVGSFTFDDSLASHLRRINEQLTAKSH